MARKPTYYELLKHPKWQEKRLRIMERAGFKCEWCERGDVTLHVHHTFYEKSAAPWEYPDASLVCLCESCHEDAERVNARIKKLAGSIAITTDGYVGLLRLEGYLQATIADAAYSEEGIWILRGVDPCPGFQGVADYFGLTWGEVDDSKVEGGDLDVRVLRELAGWKREVNREFRLVRGEGAHFG